MIISTPRNPYREFAQSLNRSTGTCAPEFTVYHKFHKGHASIFWQQHTRVYNETLIVDLRM